MLLCECECECVNGFEILIVRYVLNLLLFCTFASATYSDHITLLVIDY